MFNLLKSIIKDKLKSNKARNIEVEDNYSNSRISIKEENIIKENILLMRDLVMETCNFANDIIPIEAKKTNNISDDVIYKIFISIYEEVRAANSLEEFESILNLEKLNKILMDNLYLYIKDEYYVNAYIDSNVISIGKSIISNKIDDTFLNNLLYNKNTITSDFNVLFNYNSISKLQSPHKIQDSWIIIMCAKALNKLLLLYKYKDKFINNDELYKVSRNLYKEFKKYDIVSEKIYPIYKKFYQDTFDDVLEPNVFNTIAYLSNIDIINKDLDPLDENKIVFNHLDLNKDVITYNDVYTAICKVVEEDSEDQLYDDDIIDIYHDIINNYISKISLSELFNLYSHKSLLLNDLRAYKKEVKIKQLKERYILGDFSIEIDEFNDILDIKNVETGEDFELYLKKVFTELGYKVQMTKATGDQGADLVLIKNNIKTVVQAKFYSNTVGNKAIQEVVAAIKFYEADKGMVVTNNCYTKSAIELANANNIELIDGDKLKSIIDSLQLHNIF